MLIKPFISQKTIRLQQLSNPLYNAHIIHFVLVAQMIHIGKFLVSIESHVRLRNVIITEEKRREKISDIY
jgi:hypothetical protein